MMPCHEKHQQNQNHQHHHRRRSYKLLFLPPIVHISPAQAIRKRAMSTIHTREYIVLSNHYIPSRQVAVDFVALLILWTSE